MKQTTYIECVRESTGVSHAFAERYVHQKICEAFILCAIHKDFMHCSQDMEQHNAGIAECMAYIENDPKLHEKVYAHLESECEKIASDTKLQKKLKQEEKRYSPIAKKQVFW